MKEHDFKKGHQQSVVDPDLCVSCGICAGACPSSSPFRHVEELDYWHQYPRYAYQGAAVADRKQAARARGWYAAYHGLRLRSRQLVEQHGSTVVAAISMPCSALVPPAFIDYVLRQNLAEGVMISGCCEGDCFYRLGNTWMDQRFSKERMPVYCAPACRGSWCSMRWLGAQGTTAQQREVAAFQQDLRANATSAGGRLIESAGGGPWLTCPALPRAGPALRPVFPTHRLLDPPARAPAPR